MKCTICKENFQCSNTNYQMTVFVSQKKILLQYKKKIIFHSLTFWQEVNVTRVVSAGTRVYYFQSWSLLSLGQVI